MWAHSNISPISGASLAKSGAIADSSSITLGGCTSSLVVMKLNCFSSSVAGDALGFRHKVS